MIQSEKKSIFLFIFLQKGLKLTKGIKKWVGFYFIGALIRKTWDIQCLPYAQAPTTFSLVDMGEPNSQIKHRL